MIKAKTDIKRGSQRGLPLLCLISLLMSSSVMAQIEPNGGFVESPLLQKQASSRGATGHVTVFGDDVRRNKAVSSVGDDLVRKLAKLLGENEPKESVYPIKLTLYSKGDAKKGVPFSTSVIPIEGKGYSISLVVDIREKIDKTTIERGIMQALVLERTMRSDPVVNEDTIIKVPLWLSDGLLGATHWQEEISNRAVYNLLKKRPELFPVKTLLEINEESLKELGVTKLDIYNASATALVLALQRQQGGKQSLAKLLSEVSVFEGESQELFRRHFPTMNVGSNSLQKLWNLQLADMSSSRLLDTNTIIETEERLQQVLFFTLRGEGGVARIVALEEYAQLADLEADEKTQVINRLRQNLRQLSFRCYPDYQPLLAEYSLLLLDISLDKTEEVKLRLANLAEERERKVEAGTRVRNVLDWYQISEAKGLSGDFSGYEKVLEQIELERKRNADPVISPYVDQMSELMKR